MTEWKLIVEWMTIAIELLAIAIIFVAIVVASIQYLVTRFLRRASEDAYHGYRVTLGKALLVGLEILVAADVIRTVALEPSFENVAVLGLLVVIRTFLGWSLVVEIEGRWPWQPVRPGADGE